MSNKSATITLDDIRKLESQGYSWSESLALLGIRLVGESTTEWRKRTSQIILHNAINGLANAIERQKR